MTLFQLMKIIQDERTALKLFQRIRWKDGLICRKCGTVNEASKHGTTKQGFQKYRCVCGHVFSDTSGTVLHRKQINIQYFLYALYEIAQKKSITSVELGSKLGISQKRAWNLLRILREHCQTLVQSYVAFPMRGVVESDEAYFGKGQNSTLVQGIVQRGKHAVIVPIPNRKESTLKGNIKARAMKQTYVMTDTASAYGSLSCAGYRHFTLNHSQDEFSKGDGIHSNTIEGLWGNQKKILYSIHHGVSKKHLFKYVAEFLLKYNLREANAPFSVFLNLFLSPPLSC